VPVEPEYRRIMGPAEIESRRSSKAVLFLIFVFLTIPPIAYSQTSILMQHNDLGRTGQNLNETILNTTNVNVNSFGKLFSRDVDGYIYAQPLYVPNLSIQGQVRNVVYVATMHNSVYAFDADDPSASAPLWKINIGTPVPSNDICSVYPDPNPLNCPYQDVIPEIGIQSTPVIDSVTRTIYLIAKTKRTADSTYHFTLHALDIISGAEKFGGPVEITGQVNGNGIDSVNGVVTFNPLTQLNRPGLLLMNGVIYAAFGSVGDIGPFHGWVVSFNAGTLQKIATYCTSPNGHEAGIWQAGQGLIGQGNAIYFISGDGSFDPNSKNYGDAYTKLDASSLALVDYFTPYNQLTLDNNNIDLGSGGPVALPNTNYIAGIGKDGTLRVVDTTNMGQFNSVGNNDVQEFKATSSVFMGSPIYWNSPNLGPLLYLWGSNEYLKAFQFSGTFQTSPILQSSVLSTPGYSNTVPLSVSASGSQQGTGIIWASAPMSGNSTSQTVTGALRAFDATTLQELWNSQQNPARDDLGSYAKFCPPTIANGKVYVATFSGKLQVYGLNPGVPGGGGGGSTGGGIAFVQVAAAVPQSASVVTVSYQAPQRAGDLNIVVVGWNDTTSSVSSVTDSAGNPYRLAIGPTGGINLSQAIYYAANISGGSNAVTVTFNKSASYPDIRILEYSGVSTLDATAGAAGNSSVSSSGSVTTSFANELIFAANMVATITQGSIGNFTTRIITTPDSDIAQDSIVSTTGSFNASAQLIGSGPWVMQTATFAAAGGQQPGASAPQVSGISPNSGPVGGGTSVTITGANFITGATVQLGANGASNVAVVNSGTITATTPAGAAGTVNVTVTTSAGSGSLAGGFSYIAAPSAPSVTGVSPNSGPAAGGTAVTITGTNFAAGATVQFGANPAASVNVASATSITAIAPPGNAGTVNITVANTGGLSGTLTNAFTYISVPSGSAIGFVQVAAATPQGSTASVTVSYRSSQIAGNLNVVAVGWNDVTSSIASVADSAGNLYQVAAGPTRGGNLSQAIYYAANILGGANSVTVTFSQPAFAPDVRILEYGGVNSLDVTAVASGNSNISSSGSATTRFANELIFAANTVYTTTLGAAGGFTMRIITNPNSDGAQDLISAAAGSYNASAQLGSSGPWVMQMATFVNSGAPQQPGSSTPQVSGVSPSSGPATGGTVVNISGSNFQFGATVQFGPNYASNVTVVNSGSITATTPAGTAGAVNVTVNTSGGSGSLSGAFTYTAVASSPTVTGILPNSGPSTGGTAVTISGTNFASGATVLFGSNPASGIAVVNASTITAVAPAGTGNVAVSVYNSNGLSGTLSNGFTYASTPSTGSGVSFVQVAAAVPQSPTSAVSVNYTASQKSGDLNIVVVGWNDTSSSVQSVRDSAGNTYQLAIGPTVGTGLQQSIYFAANIKGGSNTVTVTFNQAALYPDIRILEYSGVAGILDAVSSGIGNGPTAVGGSVTTSGANELIFSANTVSTFTAGAGAGFTSRIITIPDGDIAEDMVAGAAGTYTSTAPLSPSGQFVMQTAAFK
jgi:hypothetical protein